MTPNGYFVHITNNATSNEWIHTVMNYIGPNNGEGIQIYQNSRNIANATELGDHEYFEGPVNLTLGRHYNGGDNLYGTVQVDELYYFNRVLTEAEIRMLSQINP